MFSRKIVGWRLLFCCLAQVREVRLTTTDTIDTDTVLANFSLVQRIAVKVGQCVVVWVRESESVHTVCSVRFQKYTFRCIWDEWLKHSLTLYILYIPYIYTDEAMCIVLSDFFFCSSVSFIIVRLILNLNAASNAMRHTYIICALWGACAKSKTESIN